MNGTLVSLGLIFCQLSLLAFGGGATTLPEMQRQVVDVHHWMTATEFSALFALARAAPGPNLIIVSLIGWHVAGWLGMLVTTLSMAGPSSVVTIATLDVWTRFKDHPWRRAVEAGIVPVTTGLVAASAVLITRAAATDWLLGAITVVCTVLAVTTRIHPLWLLLGGSLVALAGFVQG